MQVRTAERGGESPILERLPFIVTAFFLVACFLGGGGSRNDIKSLLFVQPIAVLAIAAILWSGRIDWRAIAVPLTLLGLLAFWMVLQLVPLPPSVWAMLPGHRPFVEVAGLAGIEQPWRAISVAPDLTLASLIGLVSPLCVLLGCAAMTRAQLAAMLWVVMALLALSILVAIGQLAGGSSSPLYLYAITNNDSGVGLFSNRNHQALFLACGFPMIAAWASAQTRPDVRQNFRRFVVLLGFALLVPMILTTGSRAGLLLGALGIACAGLIYWRGGNSGARLTRATTFLLGIAALLTSIAGAFVYFAGERAAAVVRFAALPLAEDRRFENFSTLLRITGDFFPFGSGFGTFDPIYRMYERQSELTSAYLNQAHNDALEIVLTGGIPAAAVLLAFLVWAGRMSSLAIRAKNRRVDNGSLRIAAAAVIALILLSSLVDYPLRVPALASLFALACAWLSGLKEGASRPLEHSTRSSSGPRKSAHGLYPPGGHGALNEAKST